MQHYGRHQNSPLSEPETITHIKLITHGLLSEGTTCPQFSPSRVSPARHPRPHHDNFLSTGQQCYHRIKQRIKTASPQTARMRKRKPIFEKVSEFEGNKTLNLAAKTTVSTPLIERINKGIYQRFKVEAYQRQQWEQHTRKSPSKKDQIWENFLKRQNKWLEDKKRVYIEAKMLEQARYQSRSASRSKRRSPIKANEISEVEASIRRLRAQAEALKLRLLNDSRGM